MMNFNERTGGFGAPSYIRDSSKINSTNRDSRHAQFDNMGDRQPQDQNAQSPQRPGGDFTHVNRHAAMASFMGAASEHSAGQTNYSYASLGGNGTIAGSLLPPVHPEVIEKEYKAQEAYLLASQSMVQLERYIMTRSSGIGQAISDAMELFKHPCGLKKEDPIFAHFISDLRLQGGVYVERVARVIVTTFINIMAVNYLDGYGRLSDEAIFRYLENVTLDVLILEFGTWLEQYHENWVLVSRLTPQALSKLESRDTIIDAYVKTARIVATNLKGHAVVNSPWNKNLLQTVRRNAPSRSPTYDAYLHSMDYPYGEINTPRVRNTVDEPNPHMPGDWDPIMAQAMQDFKAASEPERRSVNEELTSMAYQPEYQSNWGDSSWGTISAAQEEQKPQEKVVTLNNLHEFNLREVDPTQWFKPLPYDEEPRAKGVYVISPSDFAVISQLLTYDGTEEEYTVWDSYSLNKLPMVKLDWEKLTYSHKFITVKSNEEMEMLLTNPEKVIPYLRDKTDEEMVAEYHEVLALKELQERHELEKTDPNAVRELDSAPKIVHADVPYVFEERKHMTSVLSSMNKKAAEMTKDPISAVVLPFVDCAELSFEGISHSDISEVLPELVEGTKVNSRFMEFIETIDQRLKATEMNQPRKNWRGVRDTLDKYFATVVNRWLVEERYFAPFYGEKRHLSVKNIFSSCNALMEFLREHDPETYEHLVRFTQSEFLLGRFQLIADSATAMMHARKAASVVDQTLQESVRNQILTENVIVVTKGVVVEFNKLPGINADGPKLIQRSSSPEMFYVLDKARTRGEAHFKKERPVYFTFRNDPSSIIWALTLSPVSEDKAVLTPIGFDHSLAMGKTLVSERAFQNR